MTPEQSAALRKPFDAKQIGKLPKGGQQLDFVGHAVTTDRLLSVDPEWTWEPLALDERGLPQYDNAGGLWIKLTICGVTRLGYGDGPDPKQRIGDALRNAAMRFGVALDLWSKQELENSDPNGGDATTTTHAQVRAHNEQQQTPRQEPPAAPPVTEDELAAARARRINDFVDYLTAGPEQKNTRGWAQFTAKALAAATKDGIRDEPVPGLNGELCTLRELIEQIQVREGVA